MSKLVSWIIIVVIAILWMIFSKRALDAFAKKIDRPTHYIHGVPAVSPSVAALRVMYVLIFALLWVVGSVALFWHLISTFG